MFPPDDEDLHDDWRSDDLEPARGITVAVLLSLALAGLVWAALALLE